MNRRTFFASSAAAVSFPVLAKSLVKKLRVGVIGHTGRGNFGHGLDTVWMGLPETDIVAVADADAAGLANAKKKLKVKHGFADYRKMLATAKPDIVAVCPRHADQHHDMVLAAMEAGAQGVYIEKPFVRTPAEADSLLAASKKHGVKIAVAHRNRYHPMLAAIDKFIAEGKLGKLLEIRGRGKGDRRGGAEDLWVLGSHVLNLIHYFGGTPRSCSARLLQNGKPVTAADVKPGNEGLGPLAGNELHARYEMSRGVVAYFDSIANDDTKNFGFGLHLIGSKGVLALRNDRHPFAHWVPGNPFAPALEPRPWIPFTAAGLNKKLPNMQSINDLVHHVTAARDLIRSIRDNREPLCNGQEGAMTVEMICSVFESHRQGGRAVAFPLKERGNALAKLN
ncbi:MAG: Gfo/Idh/MocA family protein [Verrucomicrobiia bacterium]|jgi:predicted dehydrogenase